MDRRDFIKKATMAAATAAVVSPVSAMINTVTGKKCKVLLINGTQAEQDAIATTTVINNARSTNPDSNLEEWNNGANQYASDTPTEDKIFLLSEQEATKTYYGFAAYDQEGIGNTRIRMTTDYAQANGAYQNSTAGYGGYWWLRSPDYGGSSAAHNISSSGYAYDGHIVNYDDFGVVPALWLN